ncbi:MAG: exopolysaccharide biosynthesis protein, partial [Clostridiaceae bacterium]|nr:exopolysaccharide biosynthesis protein [Clostridiaceae bacterium]
PLIVFHGPFENVKKTVVGAAMTTLSHQYIAKLFLSDEEINKILGENVVETIQQDNAPINFKNTHDSNIEREDISDGRKFKGYMLIVHDPTRVKVGYSKKLGVEGELTSQIARDNGAVAAVNGGGFTDSSSGDSKWTGTGGKPVGILMSNGKILYNDLHEDEERDVVAITNSGALLVGPHSLKELNELGATEAISFGPALVVNGKGTIKSGDGGWGIAPRTAIGQRKDGAILLLVIDGRQTTSVGATLKDVENIMLQYGAVNATNLDGGSSSTMYYEGDVINNPCDPLGERSVPSAIFVK